MLGSLAQPFSKLYFKLDTDQKGVIEPNDMLYFFKAANIDKDNYVSKTEFTKTMGSTMTDFCSASRKIWKKCKHD